MCLFTHFAAGALAGGATGNVWGGALAGLASHAVLDMIPHWDHPDWRVELAAGLGSLGLLLLTPYATAPAVVGGLMGMAPDLENLFQKLGWMSRGRFVFPTHTGLLPHGRELGPRTLMWQVLIFLGCFLALGLVVPGDAAAAPPGGQAVLGRPEVTVLQADEARTVVRLRLPAEHEPADWEAVDPRRARWPGAGWTGEPGVGTQPPNWSLTVAVPTRAPVQARVVGESWWKRPADGAGAAALVTAAKPAVHRGVPLAGAMVVLSDGTGILREVTVEILHPADARGRANLRRAPAMGTGAKVDAEPVPAGVLNPDLYRRLAAGDRQRALETGDGAAKAAAGPLFAATGHWLKLDVDRTGLHRVTGQDLANWGVPATGVDPAKLRLFRGGGLHLHEDAEYPDSLQAERIGLNEVAVQVVGGGDGEWNLDDELRFYGVATSTWLDRFDPAAARLDHYDHPAADAAVYWLTWEDDATPSPLPGAPRRVAAAAAPALDAAPVTAGLVRSRQEVQQLEARGLVEDDFVWETTTSSTAKSFTLRAPAPGAAARFAVEVRAAVRPDSSLAPYEVSAWLNGDEAGAAAISFRYSEQQDSLRVRIVGESAQLRAGANVLTVRSDRRTEGQRLALDGFGVIVPTRLGADAGPLEFILPGDAVAAPGTPADLTVAAAAPAELLLWDVTAPDAAVALTGTPGTGAAVYGVLREPGADRHFAAARPADLPRPEGGRLAQPVDLTAAGSAVDYVVVAPQGFMNAAADLAAFRSTDLPGVTAPSARAVLVDDIYDNFSGGQKDWRAIRAYLKWLYEAGGHRLRYACFLGNASRDPRNYEDKVPYSGLYDLVPTELRDAFPANLPGTYSVYSTPFATDDGLVSFDTGTTFDPDVPDLACARLPALTPAEARALVDRCIAYARTPEPGGWRNRVLFVADDASRPGYPYPLAGQSEPNHTREAENLAENYAARTLDLHKIFAAAYPFPPGSRVKQQAKNDIKAALSDGTTMFYYVGHGADDNLADEQLFLSDDIAELSNGMKRFVFLAFSCDVGVYDSIRRRSMAEEFITAGGGGAVAAVCASEVSYISPNERLSRAFYAGLYPDRAVAPDRSLGDALAAGKAAMAGSYDRSNSQRYLLFGDPATRLPHPRSDLEFAAGSLDTLRAGRLHRALADDAGAGDGYDLRVGDSPRRRTLALYSQLFDPATREYYWEVTDTLVWRDNRAPVFAGNGTAGGDGLSVPFKAPLQLGLGQRGRVRLIVDGPDGAHAAVRQVPVVSGGGFVADDVAGPAVALGFADDRYRVQPGTPLEAALADTSGIAMLGTSPGNSILLEFDDTGFMTNVTDAFAYEPDSYTRGSLSFGLPADLAPGRHTAALYAADALGNVGSDTLSFELVPAGVADIASVTLFPNPTPGPCRLIFELSDPMDVRWDIYTVSGRRVRSLESRFAAAGPRILEWDGRDAEGDEIANGTYLYVLRGLAAARDGRDITRTGKLVIMR